MAILRSFRALRPAPDRASEVASVPYDVVNREEARQLAEGRPLSFLRVSRAEITLPAETDPYSPLVYETAKRNLAELVERCPMIREAEPSLYVYRLRMGDHEQTGICGTFSIDEYDQERIKKHERTRQDKEDDRTRHVLTLEAQTGPVFLAYPGAARIESLIRAETKRPPLYDFTAPDGVSHTLWRASDAPALERAFGEVPALYIADGHHRAASASRARAEKRRTNPAHRGDEDYNFFFAVAFASEQLRILPYHRVLKDLNGKTPDEILHEIRLAGFSIEPGASPNPPRGSFAMYLQGRWHGLSPSGTPRAGAASAIAKLDVSVLQSRILEPVFGIRDPRTDKRIEFVGGIRGTGELEKLVGSGQAAAAFAMHPTTIDELIAISDAGGIMPPKSTWFEPKLRDGLLSHIIS